MNPHPLPPYISILIVGAHDLLRNSLVTLISIQADMVLVGTVLTPEDTVSVAASSPDVTLLDLSISEMETLAPIRLTQQIFPHTRIIAMSGFPRQELIEKMISIGVKRYIKRGDSARAIVTTIREVYQHSAKEEDENLLPKDG